MKENKQPILSICIPTYNRCQFLSECLNSIVLQFENIDVKKNIEIIISDNNSTDNTKLVVEKFLDSYKNIKYFKNEKNIWSNKNILKVLWYASWKYTRLLWDDDCLTAFSLSYFLEIIEKEEFDVMFSQSISSENININVKKLRNEYFVGEGIDSFISYIKVRFQRYKDMISFFSFMSILIWKTDYFKDWLENFSEEIDWNDFPQDMLIYHNLKNKKIIVPDNIFVVWRLLNESYVWSTKLIKSFNDCMDFIEERNELKNNSNWQFIKKICVKWRTRNIILWRIIAKLHINYKTNRFLKKIYYFYKRWIQ